MRIFIKETEFPRSCRLRHMNSDLDELNFVTKFNIQIIILKPLDWVFEGKEICLKFNHELVFVMTFDKWLCVKNSNQFFKVKLTRIAILKAIVL